MKLIYELPEIEPYLYPKMGPILSADSSKRVVENLKKYKKPRPSMPQAREASIRPKAPPSPKGKPRKRMSYDPAFKLMVVKAALQRPQQNRIKPTCAHFPGIEPCQVGHSLLSGADRAGGARRAPRAAAVPSLEGGPSARSPGAPPPAPRLYSGSRPPHLMSA